MISSTHTVVVKYNGFHYKICKIIYGKDGSFFVTCPYVSSDKVLLLLQTINYTKRDAETKLTDAIDVGSLTDDSKRLKLSHHPSGFVQFSGEGITSGKNQDGTIKGIGIQSWPLTSPTAGPAFAVTINGIEFFSKASGTETDAHVFSLEPTLKIPILNTLVIEGHCFPYNYRRFIRENFRGEMIINKCHPSGMILPLRVAIPPEGSSSQSFLGIEMYFDDLGDSDNSKAKFTLSGSTGNVRLNEKGEKIGDGIFCVYPVMDVSDIRDLRYHKI